MGEGGGYTYKKHTSLPSLARNHNATQRVTRVFLEPGCQQVLGLHHRHLQRMHMPVRLCPALSLRVGMRVHVGLESLAGRPPVSARAPEICEAGQERCWGRDGDVRAAYQRLKVGGGIESPVVRHALHVFEERSHEQGDENELENEVADDEVQAARSLCVRSSVLSGYVSRLLNVLL